MSFSNVYIRFTEIHVNFLRFDVRIVYAPKQLWPTPYACMAIKAAPNDAELCQMPGIAFLREQLWFGHLCQCSSFKSENDFRTLGCHRIRYEVLEPQISTGCERSVLSSNISDGTVVRIVHINKTTCSSSFGHIWTSIVYVVLTFESGEGLNCSKRNRSESNSCQAN